VTRTLAKYVLPLFIFLFQRVDHITPIIAFYWEAKSHETIVQVWIISYRLAGAPLQLVIADR
jgi:hypothetical protein